MPRDPGDPLLLSVVGELVDLRGGDAGNDQTHGHDGEAGQDFIPHGSEFNCQATKSNSDHNQAALTLPPTVYFAKELTKCRPAIIYWNSSTFSIKTAGILGL